MPLDFAPPEDLSSTLMESPPSTSPPSMERVRSTPRRAAAASSLRLQDSGLFSETVQERLQSRGFAETQVEGGLQEKLEAHTDLRGTQLDRIAKAAASRETLTGRHTTVVPEVQMSAGQLVFVDRQAQRYERIAQLGEGGAGEVDLVQDRDLSRKVALKRTKGDMRSALPMARFFEEIRTVGQLEHPNIIPIHDVGVDDEGNHFFTMKYIQGETLQDIIKKLREGNADYHRRYPYERRTQIFIEILQAIRFAHNRGIIHRDLKPENIMIGEYGEVIVMDWGIAKRIRPVEFESSPSHPNVSLDGLALAQGLSRQEMLDSDRGFQTEFGSLIGTPLYMSPEQVRGNSELLDERSDLYSLAILFFEFLNLQHPLSHKTNLKDMLWGVLSEKVVDSEKLSNPHQGPVPRELCFFLRKATQKDPDARYQSAEEMLEELQANLEGRICVYCPSTFLKRGAHVYGHYLDNHRVMGVVYFILLIGVLGVGFWQVFSALSGWLSSIL